MCYVPAPKSSTRDHKSSYSIIFLTQRPFSQDVFGKFYTPAHKIESTLVWTLCNVISSPKHAVPLRKICRALFTRRRLDAHCVHEWEAVVITTSKLAPLGINHISLGPRDVNVKGSAHHNFLRVSGDRRGSGSETSICHCRQRHRSPCSSASYGPRYALSGAYAAQLLCSSSHRRTTPHGRVPRSCETPQTLSRRCLCLYGPGNGKICRTTI